MCTNPPFHTSLTIKRNVECSDNTQNDPQLTPKGTQLKRPLKEPSDLGMFLARFVARWANRSYARGGEGTEPGPTTCSPPRVGIPASQHSAVPITPMYSNRTVNPFLFQSGSMFKAEL